EATGYTFCQIAAANVNFTHFAASKGTADFLFNTLGRCITDHAAVIATYIIYDGFIKAVTADTHRIRVNYAVKRNDCNFSRAATDINYHGAAGFCHLQSSTNCRRHRLFNQSDFARACANSRLTYRTFFNFSREAGNADEDAGAGAEPTVFVNFSDEVLKHFFGDLEIGDDPIL